MGTFQNIVQRLFGSQPLADLSSKDLTDVASRMRAEIAEAEKKADDLKARKRGWLRDPKLDVAKLHQQIREAEDEIETLEDGLVEIETLQQEAVANEAAAVIERDMATARTNASQLVDDYVEAYRLLNETNVIILRIRESVRVLILANQAASAAGRSDLSIMLPLTHLVRLLEHHITDPTIDDVLLARLKNGCHSEHFGAVVEHADVIKKRISVGEKSPPWSAKKN